MKKKSYDKEFYEEVYNLILEHRDEESAKREFDRFKYELEHQKVYI